MNKVKQYKVIANAYFILDNLNDQGLVSQEEFERSFCHMLIVDDVWETTDIPGVIKCIKSAKWEGETSEGWFDFSKYLNYFSL